ncbi:MAG: hypothetical protein ACXV6K_03625 [Halobacteriota archaeon]
MTDSDTFVEDDTEGVPAPRAPCNKCAFTHHRRKHERDLYRGGSKRPGCAYYVTGVPMEILKCKKECKRYVEKPEAKT